MTKYITVLVKSVGSSFLFAQLGLQLLWTSDGAPVCSVGGGREVGVRDPALSKRGDNKAIVYL